MASTSTDQIIVDAKVVFNKANLRMLFWKFVMENSGKYLKDTSSVASNIVDFLQAYYHQYTQSYNRDVRASLRKMNEIAIIKFNTAFYQISVLLPFLDDISVDSAKDHCKAEVQKYIEWQIKKYDRDIGIVYEEVVQVIDIEWTKLKI